MEIVEVELEETVEKEEELIKPYMVKHGESGKVVATWQDLVLKEEIYPGLTYKGYHHPS